MKFVDTLNGEKRDSALTVRLPKKTIERLQKIADKHGLSQADIILHLVEAEYQGLTKYLNTGRKR